MNAPVTEAVPAFGDRTVSMIRAKYEARGTLAYMKKVAALVANEFHAVVHPRFMARQRLADADVRRLSRCFSSSFSGMANVVRTQDDRREATRVRPNAGAYSHVRFNALCDDELEEAHNRLVWLTSSHLFASSREAFFEVLRSEYSWAMHAQERVHERYDGAVRGDVEIAKAVLDNAAMLEAVVRLKVERKLPERVAITCGDGLLFGKHVELPIGLVVGERTSYGRGGLHRNSLVLGEGEDPGIGVRSWRGLTYVGPLYLRPDQEEYHARWEAAREKLADVNEIVVAHSCGTTSGDPFHGVGRTVVGGRTQMDRIRDIQDSIRRPEVDEEIVTLLTDPRMAAAVGNKTLLSLAARNATMGATET